MYTDFAAMQPQRVRAWRNKAYQAFRDNFFFDNWLGKGQGAIIEHITEISEGPKGTSGAYLHLIADIHGGGVTGDNEMEGRERRLDASWQEITIDQLRNGVVNRGRMNDQRTVFNFRDEAAEKLGRWLADSTEEQFVLTASGLSYGLNLDGSPRVTPAGQDDWTALDYADDVKGPSAGRHFRYDGANKLLVPGDSTQVVAGDKPSFNLIPALWALGQRSGVKPLRVGGEDFYVYLCSPEEEMALMQDPDFRNILVQGGDRGSKNPIFKRGRLTMNGILIQPYRRVFTTLGAASGSKFGATGTVDGTRSLLLGAQALAYADIEIPEWNEDKFDYENRRGIVINKMMGMLKPQFPDATTGKTEDFGILAIDHAL